jgi:hypothetical protein
MLDNRVTRNQFGQTNARDTEIFSDLPVQDFSKLHDFLEDFDYYTGPVTATTTNGYVLSGTGATAALAALDGGAVNFIGATTGFIATYQRGQGNFQLANGFPTWFRALLAIDTLSNSEQALAGLYNITTTPFTGGQITDGIWFSTATGTGEISINAAQNGTVTTVDTGQQIVAAAQADLKWFWTAGVFPSDPAANGRIIWEITGAGVSANARGSFAAPASFPKAATLLTPSVGIKATAATPTLTLDQLMAVKARLNPNATPAF